MSPDMINDEQLNTVTGGIEEDDILAPGFGKDAICPHCKNKPTDEVILSANAKLGYTPSEKYYCKRCSVTFNITSN